MVDAGDVQLLRIHGRMYCAHIDRYSALLFLHRFYRDALIQEHTLPLYSSRVELSVVDHALLIHNLDAGVVLVQVRSSKAVRDAGGVGRLRRREVGARRRT